MGNLFWFCLCVLSLFGLRITGLSFLRKRPSTQAVLKYFHPPNDESCLDEDEDCTDPCVLNATLLSKRREEMERRHCKNLQPDCRKQKNSPYRSIDGSCNNLLNPDWGMAETCHRRFLPHDYGDGKSYPRMSCLKEELPNARVVSNLLHRANRPDRQMDRTLYFLEWGQIFSHDVSLAALESSKDGAPTSCCDPYPRVDEHCIAVKIPNDDHFFRGKRSCLDFKRTLKCTLCKGGVRQSLNNGTSYFDLSIVYGSSEERERSLRSYVNGTLRKQYIPGIGSLPPPVDKINLCKSYNSSRQCFLAGDQRINQNSLLITLQTVLLRNHDNIAKRLCKINPHWDDDRLYEEARKINTAQAQAITYGKFLKTLLGPGITEDPEFQLDVLSGRRFTKYDDRVDASVFDEFASAVHRFGHTMIPNTFFEKDPISGRNRTIHIKDYYFWPAEFYSGQLDKLALGMAIDHPKYRSITLGSEVRNLLHHQRIGESFGGPDLAAVSIVRGREHGFPGYTHYLKTLFNYNVQSFCDLKGWIPQIIIEKMKKIYRSVHDVELYTAVLAENWVDGALLGPTGTAILAVQYRNLKLGDRYYFEHGRVPGSFTIDQLVEIREKTSLARILCETTKIFRIQPEVFLPPSESNKPVSCGNLPKLNLNYWKEEQC